jgi:H+/Cl- antiporter ClcA
MPPAALPLALAAGALGAGWGGVVFNRSLLAALHAGRRLARVPRWALPVVAGLGVGLTARWLTDAVGGGQGAAERPLDGTRRAGLGTLTVLLVQPQVLAVLGMAGLFVGSVRAPLTGSR